MNTLITGSAGFIGFHLTHALLNRGDNVFGIDNINEYYDPNLKKNRLENIFKNPKSINFEFQKGDISDRLFVEKLFNENKFDLVVNLAAQAGVRYSLDNPNAYIESNLVGFLNILEGCRHSKVKHLVYASSSSVYGMNIKQPFSEDDRVDFPISLYAATKKSNELMAHSYSHLFNIPTTGLRFFTVYGPYGRPDMAYFKFTKSILEGRPIDVFNNGEMRRDFTYIDDIIDGLIKVVDSPPLSNSSPLTSAQAPYKLFNIGNNKPETLIDFITSIEQECGKKAKMNFMPMQAGDVSETYADVNNLNKEFGFQPSTSIDEGIKKFVNWYKDYYEL